MKIETVTIISYTSEDEPSLDVCESIEDFKGFVKSVQFEQLKEKPKFLNELDSYMTLQDIDLDSLYECLKSETFDSKYDSEEESEERYFGGYIILINGRYIK